MKLTYLILYVIISASLNAQNIIPSPFSMIKKSGYFLLGDSLITNATIEDVPCLNLFGNYLLSDINIMLRHSSRSKAQIYFEKNDDIESEAYELIIEPAFISIKASDDSGYLHAIQTLRQLIEEDSGIYRIICTQIKDAPKMKWREFMLDSGRQYQKPSTIKKYLDMMAMLKMNVFHWHLTDGMGWRLEIKKFPKLVSVGSNIGEGPEQKGFYSQEEVKEIIRYAAERHIMVVPEIDMPGHSEAALIAYPEFSCFGLAPDPQMSFSPVIFCAGKESVIHFLKDILDEVCQLFPSPYIHLGGDEAPKDNWDICGECQNKIKALGLTGSNDLQRYFSSEMVSYLKTKNKKAIFWGDVLLSDGYPLPDNVVIHWWNYRSHKDMELKLAIRQNYQVICGTNQYTYLNFPVSPWAGYAANRTFDIKTAYENNPSKDHSDKPLVLGMSCALWTDYHVIESMIDQRLFPRILALSEQMWHKGAYKSFEDFYSIVKSKKDWFETKGYQFGPGFAEK